MAKAIRQNFYPKNWTGSKWIAFDPSSVVFPRSPACYVIYLDGELAYVGQASDLAKRISSHGIRCSYGDSFVSKWGAFKSIVVKARFSTIYGDWAMRELRLIHRLQPRLNCVGSIKSRGAA